MVCLAVALGAGGTALGEATIGFTSTAATSAADAVLGQDQFFLDVLDEADHQVLLRVRNTGPTASSATGITLAETGGIWFSPVFATVEPQTIVGSGVSFHRTPISPVLALLELFKPSAVTPVAVLTADTPAGTNGIGPGESLDVLATLADELAAAQLLADLQAGTVRVTLDAGGFPDGGTGTFANNLDPVVGPVPNLDVIPAPGAVLLGALGAGLAGWLWRHRLIA